MPITLKTESKALTTARFMKCLQICLDSWHQPHFFRPTHSTNSVTIHNLLTITITGHNGIARTIGWLPGYGLHKT